MSSPQLGSFLLFALYLTVHPPANRLKYQSMSRRHSQEPGTPRTSRTEQEQSNCHQGNPAVLLSATSVGGASSTTSAKSSLLIGAFLHETSNRLFSRSFSPDYRTRYSSQLTQVWLMTPYLGCWTNARKWPFAGTNEWKHESPTERQRAIISSLFSQTLIRAGLHQ